MRARDLSNDVLINHAGMIAVAPIEVMALSNSEAAMKLHF
jgi:hypothetical protein